jgi:hypothetical protein
MDENLDSRQDPHERQRQLDQARLETFIVRARRIAAHSLAQDVDQLRRLSGGNWGIEGRADGKTYLRIDYPPEEQIESAAARLRPLLLKDVELLTVLRAIRSLTADTDDRDSVRRWETDVRDKWKRRTGALPLNGGFTAFFESTETGETGKTNETELALAWIYGDVVHHDSDHLDRTRAWGVGERFRAAVPLIAFMIGMTLNVLESVRTLERRGSLTLGPAVWEDPVVAENPYVREIDAFVGHPNSEPPTSATEGFGPGWRSLSPEALDELD